MMLDQCKYVIISAVRDEEKFIEGTIHSVIAQTLRPSQWIIVNDGSTDKTGEIIERYHRDYPWICAVHRTNRGFRKPGGGVMEAFYDGFKNLTPSDRNFIVKLDGDLIFDADYFEKCFERFQQDDKLGIGGGTIYHVINNQDRIEQNPKFHVRGATKIYRSECWDAIGGLWVAPGWDTIDEVKANMLGWTTRSFPDLMLYHQRLTGTAESRWKDCVKLGMARYVSGYHPAFMASACVFRAFKKPYVYGSVGMLYGFLKGYLTRTPQVEPPVIKYVRTQQVRRLLGMQTIWR